MQIESGLVQTATHVEQMAVDMGVLFENAFPHLAHESIGFSERGFLDRMRFGGRILWAHYGTRVTEFAEAPSDVVRGWAAMAIGESDTLPFDERLSMVRRHAVDEHFAVREWAWLSLRPHVSERLDLAIARLSAWVAADNPYERRFAVEVTRPRSVWGRHISKLKEEPQIGLPLLEPLMCEPHRYVSASIGNWLNDASKHAPEWVRGTSDAWLRGCSCHATRRIVRRGTRALEAAEA